MTLHGDKVTAAAAAVVIEMDEPYVQTILQNAFSKYAPLIETHTAEDKLSTTARKLMHWREYESIDWDNVHRSTTTFASAYCIRKGLIRKAQMAFNIKLYTAKHPESILNKGVPETWIVEIDDIDYLDEALMECYEVEEGMRANEGIEDPRQRQQFILKPSLTGRGTGIYVFDTRERLVELLEREFESDDEEGDSDEESSENHAGLLSSSQAVSQIREWVIQRYINRPLLIESRGNRKFHIRTYVLAAGDLNVYVYRHMLALFAPHAYKPSASNLDDQRAHLTNTCLQAKQDGFDESQAVDLFWNLDLPKERLDDLFDQICRILSDTFAAVASESTSFQAWANCIEQFGFDFLINEDYTVYMLEANAYPDFKQTGESLKSVVEGFMSASVATAAEKFLLSAESISINLRQMMDQDCCDLVEVFAHKNERKW
ncbi:tubulin--tyrosine ligase [Coemansia sp. RSA 2703]|nr:tubulin--tyrosine ligase [Coemansia sp. RSA 2703]KAJ2377138.1 tubulin--tyrosine ligase [Coemansia sp. RSA 2607]KAJ2397743.1 tubulin--tyrosine ligase [Coemansia sp. RSA 2603]